MKKVIIIVISLIVIVLIAGAIWCYDNTRIIEKPSDEILQIAKQKDGDNISGFPYAYSLESTDTEIILTLFCAEESVKSIHTYYITDGVITSTYFEKHYITKLGAKLNNDIITNKKVENNIVSGQLESINVDIGKDAKTFYNDLMLNYSNLGLVLVRLEK